MTCASEARAERTRTGVSIHASFLYSETLMSNVVPTDRPVLAGPYLIEREAAELTRFSSGHLRNMRSLGRGPKYLRVGGAIRYRLSDLLDWMEASR
jgi:Helix-turn-helix domain